MVFFYHEEPSNSSFKRCRFLTLCNMKDVFSHCRTCSRPISSRKLDEESLGSGEVEDEQEVVILEIRTRAMEAKAKQRNSFKMDNFSWLSSPTKGGHLMIQKPNQTNENSNQTEDFHSVSSSLFHYSSATTIEQYLSANSNFSNLSELQYCNELLGKKFVQEIWPGIDVEDLQRCIQEVCQYEGWPFGLYRKALLLPPLPKSPSESWLWHKKC